MYFQEKHIMMVINMTNIQLISFEGPKVGPNTYGTINFLCIQTMTIVFQEFHFTCHLQSVNRLRAFNIHNYIPNFHEKKSQ